MQACVLRGWRCLGSAIFALALWLSVLAFTSLAEASVKRVWAVDDSQKIKKEDLSNPMATSPDNPVWNGSQITLFGAKNEIIAFQVIIEADGAGAEGINVKLDALSSASFVIQNTGTDDPFDYRGKRIELFTVLYWKLVDYTTRMRWAEESAPPPYYRSGWLPVAMIPFEAPQGLGGAPFSIKPNMNQAVWVDIYLPKNAVAGRYTGNLVVTSNGKVIRDIPVRLDVYDFALPDVTHFKNFAWANRGTWLDKHGVTFNSPAHQTIERRYMQMAHRHRLDLSLNGKLDWMGSYYKRYLTGSYYSASYGYEGPGTNIGNATYGIGIFDQSQGVDGDSGAASGFQPDNQTGWRNASDAWVTWFSQNAPNVEYFKYMRDEPQMVCETYPAIWQVIRDRSNWVHNNPGIGRKLPILCTTPISHPEVDGYIDYWMSGQWNYDLAKAATERSEGNKCGYYNGRRPYWGTGMCTYDVEAVDARVIPWIAWRYGVDQYFCWHVNNYAGENPLQNIPCHGDPLGNGIVILPGEQKDFPGFDLNLPGPIAGFSLKCWRRGQQDYEYLWLAAQKGLRSKAQAIASAIVPRALSEVTMREPVTWPLSGAEFEDGRRQLAELLAASPPPPPPPEYLVASLSASPESGRVPLTVYFTGSATGGTPPYSYRWTFGDGGSSTDQNPFHSYLAAGSYTATLTVTDSASENDTAMVAITVEGSATLAYLFLSSETGAPAPGQGGTTDPQPGTYFFSIGSSVTAKSILNPDYRFSKWSGDIAESNMFIPETTITMDKNKSLLSTFCTKCADVNGDLQITPADAQLAFDIYLERVPNPTWCELENADVKCDGTKLSPKVTPADAQMILNKYLKKDVGTSDCSGNTRAATLSVLSLGSAKAELVLNQIAFARGEDIDVPVIVESSSDIKAFGFDLVFPSDTLDYLGLETAELTKDYDQLDARVVSYLPPDFDETKAESTKNVPPGPGSRSGSEGSISQEVDRKGIRRAVGQAETEAISSRVLRVGGYKTKPSVNPSSGVLVILIFRVTRDVKEPIPISVAATYDDIQNVTVSHRGVSSQNRSRRIENEGPGRKAEKKHPGKRYDF